MFINYSLGYDLDLYEGGIPSKLVATSFSHGRRTLV